MEKMLVSEGISSFINLSLQQFCMCGKPLKMILDTFKYI